MLLQGVCGSIRNLKCIQSAAGRTQRPRMEHRWRRTEMDFHSGVVLNQHLLHEDGFRSSGVPKKKRAENEEVLL